MFKELNQWREDRKISGYNHHTQVSNIVEEMLELMYKPKSQNIEAFKNGIIGDYYVDHTTIEEKVDAYCDLIVFSVNALELLGYDAEKCMNETIKEISSRYQCPMQQEKWIKEGYDGTKWKKSSTQDIDTLYQAKYSKCERK